MSRALFATWMVRALAVGAPRAVLLFLVIEVSFFVLQSVAVLLWPARPGATASRIPVMGASAG